MADDYIKRSDALSEIDEWMESVGTALIGKGLSYYAELQGCIEDCKPADVAPVVHGRWVLLDDCSNEGVYCSAQQRQQIVHNCLTIVYQASVIALNEEFGFGPERITRFRDAMEKNVMEYGDLLTGADLGYADTVLERRYKQIMGEEK